MFFVLIISLIIIPQLLSVKFPSDLVILSDFSNETTVKIYLYDSSPDFISQNFSIFHKESNISLAYRVNENLSINENSVKFICEFILNNISSCDSYQNSIFNISNCTISLKQNLTIFSSFNVISISYINSQNFYYSFIDNIINFYQIQSNMNETLNSYPNFFFGDGLLNYNDCENFICNFPLLEVQSVSPQYVFNLQTNKIFGNLSEFNIFQVYLIVRDLNNSSRISFIQDVTNSITANELLNYTFSMSLTSFPSSFDLIIILDINLKYEQYLFTKVNNNSTYYYMVNIY